MAGLSREEQEVIITTSAADSDAEVYAADPVYIRKLDKLCERCPDYYKLVSQNEHSKIYKVSLKKLIAFRMPKKASDEDRQRRIETLRRYREARDAQF